MRDIIIEIYEALSSNSELSEHIQANDIKFSIYPNAQDITSSCIVVDTLDYGNPDDYADNKNLTYKEMYQVDLFIKQNKGVNGRLLSNRLILIIQEVLEGIGLSVNTRFKPEHVKDFNLYRQTTRFVVKQYRNGAI